MNSYSYYEIKTLPLRLGYLDRCHRGSPPPRPALASSRRPGAHPPLVRHHLPFDRLARAAHLPPLPAPPRSVALRRILAAAPDTSPRPVLERVLPRRFSQHGSRGCGRVRRVDAMVLRGRPGGSNYPRRKSAVIKRPHLLAGEDLRPAPRQKRSLAKRDQLKAAALDRFGQKGYQATSIGDIARHAHL